MPTQTPAESLGAEVAAANGESKAVVRALKQADRDLMTAREMIRAALATKGETVATVVIVTRLEAALGSIRAIGVGAFKVAAK